MSVDEGRDAIEEWFAGTGEVAWEFLIGPIEYEPYEDFGASDDSVEDADVSGNETAEVSNESSDETEEE